MKAASRADDQVLAEVASASSVYEDERAIRAFRDRLRDGRIHVFRHGTRGEPQHGVLKLLDDHSTLVWLPRRSRWTRTVTLPSRITGALWSWISWWLLLACYWSMWNIRKCMKSLRRQSSFATSEDDRHWRQQMKNHDEEAQSWREITMINLTSVRSVREGRQTTNFVRTLKYIDPELLADNDERCMSLCASATDILSSPSSSSGQIIPSAQGDRDEISLNSDTERLVAGTNSSSQTFAGSRQHQQIMFATAEWSLDLEFDDEHTRNQARAFMVRAARLAATIDLCEAQDILLPRGPSIVCYQILAHPSFELLILTVVAAAVLHIALQPFVDDDTDDEESKRTSPLEWVLLALLSFEQAAKVVALEGITPILRKPWDTFDLVTVAMSWLSLASSLPMFSSMAPIRALAGVDMLPLRVFRCLRVLKSWRGFREVLDTFLSSLPMAGNALLCYCYYLFLFSILGMYIFNDSLSHRCAVDMGSSSGSATDWVAVYPNRFCSMDSGGISTETPGCGGSTSLQACVSMIAPNNGNTGFHSFQASFLTVYLITLRAGFGSAFDGVRQATSFLSIAYFIALVVFVSYTILSLFIGIVRGSYISVSILGGARQRERKAFKAAYADKKRPRIPSATDTFPDIAFHVSRWWQRSRANARDALLRSPLFQSRDDPDDSFLASFRLRQHRIFYLLEPGGAVLDRIAAICESQVFEHFMNAVVFVNAVLFSLEYHGMSTSYAARLYAIETSLIVLYAIEFVLVCANAGGLMNYLHNPWNRLDFVILVAAAAEYVSMAVSLVLYTDTTTRVVFAFRLFRLVRPFRAVRSKNELMQVLDALLASVPALLSVTAFFLVLMGIFAVLGMRLFGGKFPSSMRSHFDTFGDSMLTLFKVACGGNVWQIFHASLDAAQTSVLITMGFYLAFLVLTAHLTLNIIVVVILRNFAMNEDERKKTLSALFQERMLIMQRVHHFDEYTFVRAFSDLYQNDTMYLSLAGSAEKRAKITSSAAEELKLRLLRVLPMSEFLRFAGHSRSVVSASNAIPHAGSRFGNGKYKALLDPVVGGDTNAEDDNEESNENSANRGDRELTVVIARPSSPNGQETGDSAARASLFPWHRSSNASSPRGKRSVRSYIRCFVDGQWLTADVSLFLFPPNSPFRLRCKQLEKETDKYIFSAIVIRTIMLTVQSPLYSALIQEITMLSDIVFACVLLFEFTIKVISRGFMLTPNSYLSNPINQMNMVVMMACSLLLLLPHSPMRMLFRLGRAFGPVRVFYRVKTFRVITEALKQSAKQLLCCVLLAAFMFYAFATLGMQLFAGKFSFCNDASVHTRAECDGFFASDKSSVLMPRVWGNLAGMHFDNIGGAMGSVLVLVSKKGWLPVLNLAMDIVDSDHQPVQNASAYFALFFVAFIFFSRFYVLKVFAGIIMNNFRCHNGTLLLTNLQLMWMRNKQAVLALRPKYPLPRNSLLQLAQRYAQARRFRAGIGTVVMLHTFLLAWYRSPGVVIEGDEVGGVWWCHYVFSTVYALDAVISVASMGWKDFFMKGFTWRTFNSVTAFVMLVGPLVSDSPVLLILFMTRAFDFKYISLVFERFAALSTLFETLHASSRLTLKVSLLLGYALFVFAIIGVQVFPVTRWGYGLDSNTNFATFPNAFATFVKFAAGEDWFDTYQASSVAAPRCVRASATMVTTTVESDTTITTTTTSSNTLDFTSDCGSSLLSALFFNIFYLLVALVLQNLYAATILDTYVSTSAVVTARIQSQKLLGFTSDHLRRYQQVWSEFDTGALGFVHIKHLLAILTRLESPLGLGTHAEMLAQCINEDTSRQRRAELECIVHQHRREVFHDIEARVAELAFRSLVAGGGVTGTEDALPGLEVISMGIGAIGRAASGGGSVEPVVMPGRMLRFSDLLFVLTSRIVPLDSLTVQEKVDELAVRGYSFRHRQAVRIQATFRMYRVRRHQRWIKRQSPPRKVNSQLVEPRKLDEAKPPVEMEKTFSFDERPETLIVATDVPQVMSSVDIDGLASVQHLESERDAAASFKSMGVEKEAEDAVNISTPIQQPGGSQSQGTVQPRPREATTSAERLMLLFEHNI